MPLPAIAAALARPVVTNLAKDIAKGALQDGAMNLAGQGLEKLTQPSQGSGSESAQATTPNFASF